MYLDHENLFSDAQAVTVTAASSNIIDLGPIFSANAARDIGRGSKVTRIYAILDATFTAGGAGTLDITLQGDDNSAFGSPRTLFDTGVLALAALFQGAVVLDVAMPTGVEKFLRLMYTVATGPMTAGAITAGLVLDSQSDPPYAANYPV